MPLDPLDLAATPERLHALAEAGVLSPEALERASRLAVATPGPAAWRRFLSTTLLGFGSLLVLSGVIYFFAFNWQALHRFGKLGLVLAAVTGACIAAWRLGEGLAGQFALLFAAVLVGPLLAIYGQAYQTGADPYGLFLGWAVLILPWVVLARFSPLWLWLLLLVDTALILYWDQVVDRDGPSLFLTLAGINGVAWAATEEFSRRGVAWLQGRWLPRVLAMMTVLPLLGPSVMLAASPKDADTEGVVALCLLVGLMGAVYLFHRRVRPELFLLTLCALCAVTLITTFGGYLLFKQFRSADLELLGAYFALGLLVIAQMGLAVWWLRAEARDEEEA
ncbi:DUF2157 domain-containing protein [Cystobacter ferrugineus]|uniref:DUF2157 domain-containing protein n=1 Tax=Cystobacter ferrugineus TaxID=83449 RepID=A0A1L9AZY4_9BACT|nr:DUF2157 domain-containing protein [Cystobacter ferrugineus]OJH35536.1 hypothetical protein BON30_37895 [Cystobacter ferrugineus]